MPWLFPVCAFVSAFLLFAIEPAVGKMLLPGFGGSALVWGTCMIGFQSLLCIGYLSAYLVTRRLGMARYSWIHLGLLVLASCLVAFHPPRLMEVLPRWHALLEIPLFMARSIGLPFLLLSFTTPLLQWRWASLGLPAARAYHIFSASNLGSFAALLSYVLLIEPSFGLSPARLWWMGLLGLACLFVPLFRSKGALSNPSPETAKGSGKPMGRKELALSFLFSAAGSAMLLAVTNVLTYETASVPQLWVIPLSLYLLTFVIVFRVHPRALVWLDRVAGWWVGLSLILYLLNERQVMMNPAIFILVHLVTLFFGCLWAHARLARFRPADSAEATAYYAAISVGGLIGTIIVVVIAPLLANSFIEYPLSLLLVVGGAWLAKVESQDWWKRILPGFLSVLLAQVICVLASASLPLSPQSSFALLAGVVILCAVIRRSQAAWLVGTVLGVWFGVTSVSLWLQNGEEESRWRSYYGIYKLLDRDGKRTLNHGTTTHGAQYLAQEKRHIALTYYHHEGPAGELFTQPSAGPREIGMIGLGAGALLAHGRSGDSFQIFELDPLNVRLADEKFTYWRDALSRGVKVGVTTGDGRLNLRPIPDASYDLFAVDAFSGDAIPIHLLTVEAMREYERVTKADGIVLLHISNRLLRLEEVSASVVRAIGREPMIVVHGQPEDQTDIYSSVWLFFSRDAAKLRKHLSEKNWSIMSFNVAKLPKPWTDQHSNLLPAISFDQVTVLPR